MGKKVVCFGEIMGRIEPEGFMRFRQSMPGNLQISFAGAEGSVAASLQMMGRETRYVTALPENDLGEACLDSVRRFGIDTSFIIRAEGRLGLYFLETGANQRPSNVIYDREGSLVSQMSGESYNWDAIFSDSQWFHISGITPAISVNAAEAALMAVKKAKEQGATVSCDLNFRKKLWRWDKSLTPRDLAEKTMRKMLPYVDVVIGNEEDAWDILGIKTENSDVESGHLEIERYPEVARRIVEQFPNVGKVAITLRESLSASHNNWGAMLYDSKNDSASFAPMSEGEYKPYQIKFIVDRVGGGDSFSAGLIYALTDNEFKDNMKEALSYAVSASCLCHSIKGDFNYSTRNEVISLMRGNSSGRVKR
ncbi:MAG: sugar kinase [Spirochaetales bacterium]|nr:sugar kinase [Spirochaetales bacterium]